MGGTDNWAGANYYLSVRQFLEAEKKIRIRCLVKFSNMNMKEINEISHGTAAENKAKVERDAARILAMLPSDGLSDYTATECDGEETVVYYIAGFIARSVLKQTKCECCTELIAKDKTAPQIEIEDSGSESPFQKAKEDFLNSINRGGLVHPSDLVHLVCMQALHLRNELFHGEIEKAFFETELQLEVFVDPLRIKLDNTLELLSPLDQECDDGHNFASFIPNITAKFFNCLSKNVSAKANDSIHASRKRAKKDEANPKNDSGARKIKKLQSN